MVTLLTALSKEAEALIRELHLKRETSFLKFPLFVGEDVRLLITGTGSTRAAIALTHLLSLLPPDRQDLFLNVGICGCRTIEPGTCLLCNKITELATGRSFYPDILYHHPFQEIRLITASVPVLDKDTDDRSPDPDKEPCAYDMEAAGFYQAGTSFLSQHQLLFLKIVSDPLRPDQVTPTEVSHQIEVHLTAILDFLDSLRQQISSPSSLLTLDEVSGIKTLADKLALSATMTEQLFQLFRYAKTLGCPAEDGFHQFFQWLEADGKLFCTKKEGGRYLEQFCQFILSGRQEGFPAYLR